MDKVNWLYLSENPNAIHILEQNLEKIDWARLSLNPNAITLLCSLDYHKMFLDRKDICEELVEVVFHPKRIQRICDAYDMDMADYIDIM
jgi:hypothetical protein